MVRERARRASPGYTYDPCPVCHGERQPHSKHRDNDGPWIDTGLPQRKKDQPCHACMELFAEAERIVLLRDADEAQRVAMTEHRGTAIYINVRDDFDLEPQERSIRDALEQLAEATGLPVPKDAIRAVIPVVAFPHQERDGGVNSRTYSPQRRFTADQIAAFRATADAIVIAIEDAYRRGHEDGADLLRRLAAGDVTVFDYDAERARVKQ